MRGRGVPDKEPRGPSYDILSKNLRLFKRACCSVERGPGDSLSQKFSFIPRPAFWPVQNIGSHPIFQTGLGTRLSEMRLKKETLFFFFSVVKIVFFIPFQEVDVNGIKFWCYNAGKS